MKETINLRQQKFIEHYLESGNAKEAVIKAGYKRKYPDRYGYLLLNRPEIKEKIEKYRAQIEKKTEITFEWKLKELKEILLNDPDSNIKIKAIEVMNKMQGHNAPNESINTVTINNELMTLKALTEEILLDDYKTRTH